MNKVLVIDGAQVPNKGGASSRYHIQLFDKDVYLRPKSFCYLVKMAHTCIREKSDDPHIKRGWTHKTELEPGGNQACYIYNLRRELGCVDTDWAWRKFKHIPDYLMVADGCYSLNIKYQLIRIVPDNLLTYPDCDIQAIGEALQKEADDVG